MEQDIKEPATDTRTAIEDQPPPPRCVMISALTLYEWLNTAISDVMRRRYGTRFVVLVGSPRQAQTVARWCREDDRIIQMDDIAADSRALSGTLSDDDVFAQARAIEARYEIAYFRDVVQQDRTIYGGYLAYADGPLADVKPPAAVDLCRQINGYFAMFEKLFAAHGVDLVLSRPGSLMDTSALYVAMGQGLPVTMARHARIGSKVTWTFGPYSNGYLAQQRYEQTPETAAVPLDQVRPPSSAAKVFAAFTTRYGWRGVAKELLVMSHTYLVKYFIPFLKTGRFNAMRPYRKAIFGILKTARAARWMKGVAIADLDRIAEQPFVFFPLPKEPEYTVQSLARNFSNVQAMIEQLSLSLPAGFRLVVKEHSRLGDRRRTFYRDLLKLPNVVFADPTLPGVDVSARACAVATVAGTAAFEALSLGKPAIVFASDVEYGFLPDIYLVRQFADLPMIVRHAVAERSAAKALATRQAAARFRAAYGQLSFDADGTKAFGGTAALPMDQAERAVDLLLETASAARAYLAAGNKL